MQSSPLYVITGQPGSGKTPLVGELARRGHDVFAEPARAILAEQRAIGGDGTHDRNPRLFYELMLERAIDDFRRAADTRSPTFFDRGIPDMVGYAGLFGHDPMEAEAAARDHRYADVVFALPSWPEIYTTDEERHMTFEFARDFGDHVREVYVGLGYEIVDVPRDTPQARATFVLGMLGLDG